MLSIQQFYNENSIVIKGAVNLKTDFHELKKEFVRKKVADANQFIDNIVYNYKVLEYCKGLILALTTEYDRRVSEYHSEI